MKHRKLFLFIFVTMFFCASATIVSAQFQYEVDQNTLALWHFNEGVGTFYADETGNHLSYATNIVDSPNWTIESAPLLGNPFAIQSDGSSGIVYVADLQFHNMLSLTNTDFTIEAWINFAGITSGESKTIFARVGAQSSSYFYRLLIPTSGRLVFEADSLIGQTPLTSNSIVPIGQFVHVAIVYDQTANQIVMYINGVQEDVRNVSGTMTPSFATLGSWIAWSGYGNGKVFNGIIDELRISNVARDVSEFNNNPLPACYEGTVNVPNSQQTTPVFSINNNVGQGAFPRVQVNVNQPFDVTIAAPPSLPLFYSSYFALYMFTGEPSQQTLTSMPLIEGDFCFPPTGPNSATVFNTLGFFNQLGVPVISLPLTTQAPYTFSMPSGVPFATNITLQGLIVDGAAPNPALPLSITNAITLEVV